MPSISHRRIFRILFLPILLAAFTVLTLSAGDVSQSIDDVLNSSIGPRKLPGIVAMAADSKGITYQGAVGEREAAQHLPMAVDSIFRIASMTKTVTSVALMQFVESGKVKLDEPAATYLPELAQVQVLEDFDASTKTAKLRPPKTQPTIRQLLTHTSGFAYEFFDPKLGPYVASGAVPSMSAGDAGFLKAPLVFDPGTRWEYGISIDFLGRIVEKLSGQSLEEYFHQHIFQPLGMTDTFFNVPAEKQSRVVALYMRAPDGNFIEPPQPPFRDAKFFSGGGGLYSTAGDYMKFVRMLLAGGKLDGKRILKAATIAEMSHNQIGDLRLLPLTSLIPQIAKNPIHIPGSLDVFGFGFAINSQPVEGARAAGSLAWAGIHNTYFWIDPSRKICGVILMQILPFSDDEAVAAADQFERAVYAASARSKHP